jgi:hypothetical protein
LTPPTRIEGSFRDPAGQLFRSGKHLSRTVASWFEAEFQAFLDSGLYDELVADGLLIAHEELDPRTAPHACARYLRTTALPFVTYPWEWSASQLRAAADLTMELQLRALERSLSLRDASAFNVQFRGHRPVFVDTLSFGQSELDQPWPAYGQFCRHFLAPLALRTHVDSRLADLQQLHLDGIPLDLTARLLPQRTKLSPALGVHLHAHARATRKGAEQPEGHREVKVGPLALRGVAEQLQRAVRALTPPQQSSHWSDYEFELDHYDQEALDLKRSAIDGWASRLQPRRTIDLGSNRGGYSRLVAAHGNDVLAIDADHATVEQAACALAANPPSSGSVLAIRGDLLSPSPDIGWSNRERDALVRRTQGDLVLALALIHHVVITGEVPLDRAIAGIASHGRHLVIEWVPTDDPKVRQLLSTRPERIRGYDAPAFQAAMSQSGRVLEQVELGSTGRVLYLVEISR